MGWERGMERERMEMERTMVGMDTGGVKQQIEADLASVVAPPPTTPTYGCAQQGGTKGSGVKEKKEKG